MNEAITQVVKKITGRTATTEKEVVAELRCYIQKQTGDDSLLIDNDIATLAEIAAIYHPDPESTLITNEFLQALQAEPLYKRVGVTLDPNEKAPDKRICTEFAKLVIKMHPDLHFDFKKRGIIFIRGANACMTVEDIRSVEGMPSVYSARVIFPNIKDGEELNRVIPQHYIKGRKWWFRGSHNRCECKYLLTTEILDLIMDREVILPNDTDID